MTGRLLVSDEPFGKRVIWCRFDGKIPHLTGGKACSLMLHRGAGMEHFDLIFLGGSRCLTISLWWESGRWHARRLPDHRRRYLTYRGPVGGGRGQIDHLWHGLIKTVRLANGLRISSPEIPFASLFVLR
jgi:hypothetical protein